MNNTQNVIDCDATPFCPEYWTISEHKQCGKIQWDPEKSSIIKFISQGAIDISEIIQKMNDAPVVNANVLDYLLSHQHLIPKEWMEYRNCRKLCFWGTVYSRKIDVRDTFWIRKLAYMPGACPSLGDWQWEFIPICSDYGYAITF